MKNIVIILLLLVVVCIAMRHTVMHFKGQGGCCGGGAYKPKKKKLKRVIEKREFRVSGMHCENCSNKVMGVLNDIPYVSATVNLKKEIVTVSYENMVDDSLICEKVEKAGYQAIRKW